MCDNCNTVILREEFSSPQDYLNCLAYISELVASDQFRIVEQTCSLDAVKDENGCWVNDDIHHKIVCKDCGEWFLAYANTYRGGGRFYKEDERLKNAKTGSLFDL